MAEPGTASSALLSEISDSHKLPWYEPRLTEVEPEAKELLEKYSKIPSNKVVQHVNSVVSGLSPVLVKLRATQVLIVSAIVSTARSSF